MNGLLLLQRYRHGEVSTAPDPSVLANRLEARYGDEEHDLLLRVKTIPEGLIDRKPAEGVEETVHFLLFASIEDCTNCIEDEVMQLNSLVYGESPRIAGIHGFFIDEERDDEVASLQRNLRVQPEFPVAVANALAGLPGATTPLVLVVRARDGKILDAHKPIPEDLTRRDAFYARWSGILGLS